MHQGVVLLILLLYVNKLEAASTVRFTNLKCEMFDNNTIAAFTKCRLRVLRRNVIALTAHLEFYQLPISNVGLNFSLLKKANGYRPFLYNYTLDYCKFLQKRKTNLLLEHILKEMEKYANMDKKCPITKNIIVNDMILHPEFFNLIPVPTGDYLLKLRAGVYDDVKGEMNIYFSRTEDI